MRLIVLAAGKSSRIFKDIGKHKCLLNVNNQTLLSKIINDSLFYKIKKISVVVGYRGKILKDYIQKHHKKVKIINNKQYYNTDMLHSAILGLKGINEDVIISYSDIFYDKKILNRIIKKKSKDMVIPIKTDWRKVWKMREKKIKSDAESLEFNKQNCLLSIGGKILNKYPKGQYMGLIFIPKNLIKNFLLIYKNNKIKKMQISNYLNLLIKNNFKIKVIKLKNYWYEFDDIEDFNNFKLK